MIYIKICIAPIIFLFFSKQKNGLTLVAYRRQQMGVWIWCLIRFLTPKARSIPECIDFGQFFYFIFNRRN